MVLDQMIVSLVDLRATSLPFLLMIGSKWIVTYSLILISFSLWDLGVCFMPLQKKRRSKRLTFLLLKNKLIVKSLHV